MKLTISAWRYNKLPDDAQQPLVSQEHINKLADMFVKHNAHKILGLHLIHGHFRLHKNRILVGTNFENPAGRWTKATKFHALQDTRYHGHIFVVTGGAEGMLAYEFQEGPLPDMSAVNPDFISEFINYILTHKLAGLLGLQVLCDAKPSMMELVIDEGTVMIELDAVKNTVPTRQTGWMFEAIGGNPRVCQANETHAKMNSGNHKVYNAGKPFPILEDIADLKAALADAGVI